MSSPCWFEGGGPISVVAIRLLLLKLCPNLNRRARAPSTVPIAEFGLRLRIGRQRGFYQSAIRNPNSAILRIRFVSLERISRRKARAGLLDRRQTQKQFSGGD